VTQPIALPPGWELEETSLNPQPLLVPDGWVLEEAASPSTWDYVQDGAQQAVHGFNRGVNALVGLPGELLASGAEVTGLDEKLGFDANALRWNREGHVVSDFMNAAEAQPKTDVGRYANAMGQAVGMNALPSAGLIAAAPKLATVAATTPMRGVAQSTGQQIAARPAAAAGVETVSAAGAGGATLAAADGGYGPLGQTVAGLAGGIAPGVALSYALPSAAPVGSPTGRSLATQRADDARDDMDAFARQGVKAYGPSLNSGPVASVANQLSETPFIGSPLRENARQSISEAGVAVDRAASRLAQEATAEGAGQALQGGIQRFAQAGLSELDPSTVRQLGIDPVYPVQRADVMGAGQAQRAQDAELLRQDLSLAPPAPTRNAYLTRRTSTEDLSDQDLQRVIRAPSAQTSFATRAEALYERARRFVPTFQRANGTVDPTLLPATNTRAALQGIQGDIRRSFQGQTTINGDLAERLSAAQSSNFPLTDLFAIRTQVGADLGNLSPMQTGLNRQQLSSLYGALSQDIEAGLIDIANRALLRTQEQGSRAVSLPEARRAARALEEFRKASRFYRSGQQQIERLLSITNAKSPEQAASDLLRAAREGAKGSAGKFRSAMRTLRPEERSQFSALIIRDMGAKTPGTAGRIDQGDWSPTRFLTSYQSLSAEARAAMFPGEHGRTLDDLMRVARRLAHVEAQANGSRTATNAINITGTVGMLSSVAAGNIDTALLIGGSGWATSVLMSRPAYARWMVRYLRLRANVRNGTDRSLAPLLRHISGVERHAHLNPALTPVIAALQTDVEDLQSGQ